MYLLGIIAAVIVAIVLRATFFRGPTPPFVMELPSYKFPSLRLVLYRMAERGWAFVRRAGTLILAVTILVWAAGYFPRDPEAVEGPRQGEIVAAMQQARHAAPDAFHMRFGNEQQQKDFAAMSERLLELPHEVRHDLGASAAALSRAHEQIAALDERLEEIGNEIQSEYLRRSFLGQAGQWVEPLVAPLGWDWRLGCAAIASFPAREVIVSTLGVIYALGDEQDEESEPLRDRLKQEEWGRSKYRIPVALSIMVFFALCAQCASTLVILRRETNTIRWPVFTFVYMTVLAYLGALATYQIGKMIIG